MTTFVLVVGLVGFVTLKGNEAKSKMKRHSDMSPLGLNSSASDL